jgi:hypothetical protein
MTPKDHFVTSALTELAAIAHTSVMATQIARTLFFIIIHVLPSTVIPAFARHASRDDGGDDFSMSRDIRANLCALTYPPRLF